MVTKIKDILLIMTSLMVLLWAATSTKAQAPSDPTAPTSEEHVTLQTSPLLQYQGRLTHPSTSESLEDGFYTMTFSIYDVSNAGTALWTETKSIQLLDGVFNTILGDTASLNQALFNGQELWLGVKVGADPEATPRQQILPVAYALSLVPGAVIDGNLTVNGALNGGTAWTSANDGSGSTLDADLLDGQQASAFATNGHLHDSTYVNVVGPEAITGNSTNNILNIEQTGTGRGLQSIAANNYGVWGQSTGGYSGVLGYNTGTGYGVHGSSVNSFGGYFFGGNGTAIYGVGNAEFTGNLIADKLVYSTPRTHYFSVSSAAFVPRNNVDYYNSGGMGGAYITTGSNSLVASADLPHGAVVTRLTVYFNDTSSYDMNVTLYRLSLTGNAYSQLAELSSSGTSGYYSLTDTTISNPTINNIGYGYLINAYSANWNSSLKIMGAYIAYTLAEAP